MKKIMQSLLAIAVLGACTTKEQPAADSAAATMPAPDQSAPAPAAGATAAVTDPQIAAIVVAANTADIEAGRLAASKSGNAKVKEFAQRMITDHSGVNTAATALVKKLGVTPEETATSRQQTEGGAATRQTLQGKSGADFDRAYIASEVTYHQNLLGAIDSVLLPSVQNAELKALLDQTRPAVVSHLKAAQDLQGSLGTS